MKLIPLTQGKFAQVDDEDFENLNQFMWYARKDHNNYYAVRQGNVIMHRKIIGANKYQIVDHKDRNGLNNQKSNLRFCTSSQNAINRRKRKNCISNYIGVSPIWSRGKDKKLIVAWRSVIVVGGIKKFIGRFNTEENAAIAYNIFAEKYHGEFANYNK